MDRKPSRPTVSTTVSQQSDPVQGVHQHRAPRNIVLCFDGTGNQYKGDGKETNVLKIFRMLDKNSSQQGKAPWSLDIIAQQLTIRRCILPT